jgi:hypothetical protein
VRQLLVSRAGFEDLADVLSAKPARCTAPVRREIPAVDLKLLDYTKLKILYPRSLGWITPLEVWGVALQG